MGRWVEEDGQTDSEKEIIQKLGSKFESMMVAVICHRRFPF